MQWFRDNDFDQVHSVHLDGHGPLAFLMLGVAAGSVLGFRGRGMAAHVGTVVAVVLAAGALVWVGIVMLEPFDSSVQEVEYLLGAWLGGALALVVFGSAVVAAVDRRAIERSRRSSSDPDSSASSP
jgi:hypothetical protein